MIPMIPKAAARIITELEEQGYQAYVVGGCVRDSLLGQQAQDWDICTSATPPQVMACFAGWPMRTNGLKHGTVTLIYGHQPYELTTFRREGEYSDKRRPDQVEFVSSLRQDLARRDFTINALAWHPEQGLLDYYGGVADLRARCLRAVGQPEQRFAEDALRILRGLRFAAVFDLDIESATAAALHSNKEALVYVAAERLQTELLKLLPGPRAAPVLAEYSDVLTVFIPEITPMIGCGQHNPYHHLDVWRHSLAALDAAPPDPLLRLAALLHDIGKPACA